MSDAYEYTSTDDPTYVNILSEIEERFITLLRLRGRMLNAGVRPDAVLMPARVKVLYTGEGAEPDFKGSMFGLPLVYGDGERWGFVVGTES